MFRINALERITTIISRGRDRPNSLTWSMLMGGLPPRIRPSTRAAAASFDLALIGMPFSFRSLFVPMGDVAGLPRHELREDPAQRLGHAHLRRHRAH